MTWNDFMVEILSPVNIGLTILLGLSVLYWIFTIISGTDVQLDLDLDADLDGSLDVSEHDGLVEINHEPSAWVQFLRFLDLDVIPITFFLTIFFLFSWVISVNLNYYFPLPHWMGFLLLIPIMAASLLFAKWAALPFRSLFKVINHQGEKPYDFLGRTGIMRSAAEGDKFGMLELLIQNDPIKLMVKTKDGKRIETGEQAMVIDESSDKKFYYVKSYEEIN